jgi:uncharacterized protein YdhG (YjbR/CyaY superfamily)
VKRQPLGGLRKEDMRGEKKMDKSSPKTIDEYIERYPKSVQVILRRIRITIKQSAPSAKEAISYQIPTFKLGENLVHFAAFTDHISFFPTSSGVAKFKKDLEKYGTSKVTIRFPIGKPIPYELIEKITKFRVEEITRKGKKKRKKSNSRPTSATKETARYAQEAHPTPATRSCCH